MLNLYRDVFYIPDPTLAFVGLSVNVSAFSCFEYQGLAAARVLAGAARIPSIAGMRAAYARMVAQKGAGKFSHYLGREGERTYVAETVAWLNAHAERYPSPSGCIRAAVRPVAGHSPAWIAAQANLPAFLADKYGLDPSIMAGLAEAKPAPSAASPAAAVPDQPQPQIATRVIAAA